MGDRDPIPRFDLYRELEVDPSASPETIEAAYRSLMKRHHPDRAGDDGLTRSKRLNLAHDWLSEPAMRVRYDAARRGSVGPTPPRPAGPSAGQRPTTRSSAGSPSPRPAAGRAPAGGQPPRNRPPAGPPPPKPRRTVWHATPVRPSGSQRARTALSSARLRRLSSVRARRIAMALGFVLLVLAGGRLVLAAAGYRGVFAAPIQTASPAPSAPPTFVPATSPVASPTGVPTAIPTPPSTGGLATESPTPAPTSAGSADLRFSGDYTEHYVAVLGGADTCRVGAPGGGSPVTAHGFHVASDAKSPAQWTLALDDITGSWTIGLAFGAPSYELYWFSGTDAGSVSATPSGFAVDVVMTDVTHTIRIRGIVDCR